MMISLKLSQSRRSVKLAALGERGLFFCLFFDNRRYMELNRTKRNPNLRLGAIESLINYNQTFKTF